MICECTSHLKRKEGDGYMQQILKLKFSCNYINQNARPLQTIQHKKQTEQRNTIAIREQYAQQQQEKKLERKCKINIENQTTQIEKKETIAT